MMGKHQMTTLNITTLIFQSKESHCLQHSKQSLALVLNQYAGFHEQQVISVATVLYSNTSQEEIEVKRTINIKHTDFFSLAFSENANNLTSINSSSGNALIFIPRSNRRET